MDSLRELLTDRFDDLVAYCARHGGTLLRYETAEDLAQGVSVRALQRSGGLEDRGRDAMEGWLFAVARSHLADRRDYWGALKRISGPILRITGGDPSEGGEGAVAEPAVLQTGASTFAARREVHAVATRALDLLLDRDREILAMEARGASIHDMAEALGTEYDAARRARSRALVRFRKAYDLIRG